MEEVIRSGSYALSKFLNICNIVKLNINFKTEIISDIILFQSYHKEYLKNLLPNHVLRSLLRAIGETQIDIKKSRVLCERETLPKQKKLSGKTPDSTVEK